MKITLFVNIGIIKEVDAMPYSFETKHLTLRAMKSEDLEDMFNIWGSKHVMKYSGGPSTKEQIKRSIAYYQRLHN